MVVIRFEVVVGLVVIIRLLVTEEVVGLAEVMLRYDVVVDLPVVVVVLGVGLNLHV